MLRSLFALWMLFLAATPASAGSGGDVLLSGRVLRADTLGPAAGVDVNLIDLVAGVEIFPPGDITAGNGTFSILVPPGIYEVSFGSSLWSSARLEEISAFGAAVELPTVIVEPAFHVFAAVGAGAPVSRARLRWYSAATGEEIFVRDGFTGQNGLADVVVPPGIWDVRVDPPDDSSLVPTLVRNVVVASDLNLGTLSLLAGSAVSGKVFIPFAEPIRGVQLEFIRVSDGTSIPLIQATTDAAGQYLVRVLPDTYDIRYTPTLNSAMQSKLSPNVTIAGDVQLPNANLTYINSDGDQWQDVYDNCPFRANLFQFDFDGDGHGDQCDRCPLNYNPRQEDNDLDGIGDPCDGDDDGDGLADFADADLDGDGLANDTDSCLNAWNPVQSNVDGDTIGDACDSDDGIVETLQTPTKNSFLWREETGALGYQVYRQRLDWLSPINFGVCAQDVPGYVNFFHHGGDAPPPGIGYGYLVTARMSTGEGELGLQSDGTPRLNLRACP